MDDVVDELTERVDLAQYAVYREIGVREVPDARLGVVQYTGLGRYDVAWLEWWELRTNDDLLSCRELMQNAFKRSALWFVSDEMTEIVDHAAREMPPHRLAVDAAPDPHGFVVFHRPLHGIDARQESSDLRVGAMSWHTFTPIPEQPRPVIEVISWTLIKLLDKELWFPIGRASWVLGEMSDVWQWVPEPNAEHALASATEDRHRISALWTLARQERPGKIDRERPDRAALRRSRREDIEIDTLRVVRLRRSERAAGLPVHGGVEWSHRWIVSGHWHHYWCGKGKTEQRLQWIAAYPKGPDDKPLVLKDTVKALVR